PGETTSGLTHVRDNIDLKRMMITVVVALIPATLFGMWNVGYQANNAIQKMEQAEMEVVYDWHHTVHSFLGFGHDPTRFVDNFVYGAIYFLPIYIVTMFVGGHIEMFFSMARGHEINEGFLVTGLLFPLTLPASIPLWQVALGIAFGVIVAKEVFGGTGKNFLNVALTSRAFLYFAYAPQISGDRVWTAVDGFSGATALGAVASAKGAVGGVDGTPIWQQALQNVPRPWGTESIDLSEAFMGTIQGCVGETSTLMCIIGAAVLIFTGVGSWRIMAGVIGGVFLTASLLNTAPTFFNDTPPMFAIPWQWHLFIGGLAFGLVFMATDPVSASMTQRGQWFYGILIGFMTILVRVVNPAYPEGIMLAILFGYVFAPLFDYFVVQRNVSRRAARYVAT
ncbi:MAG: NADH:ubiquinone reductase (Na(+)-transporting) subunit B, partial [Planctomycetota bacterium]